MFSGSTQFPFIQEDSSLVDSHGPAEVPFFSHMVNNLGKLRKTTAATYSLRMSRDLSFPKPTFFVVSVITSGRPPDYFICNAVLAGTNIVLILFTIIYFIQLSITSIRKVEKLFLSLDIVYFSKGIILIKTFVISFTVASKQLSVHLLGEMWRGF